MDSTLCSFARSRAPAGSSLSIHFVRVVCSLALLVANLSFVDEAAATIRGVTLRWIPSATPAVVGYQLSVGDRPGSYDRVIDLGPHGVMVDGVLHYVIALDDRADQYLAMRAVDDLGHRSAYSNEVVVPAFGSSPRPVGDPRIAVETGVGFAIDSRGKLALVDAFGSMSMIDGLPMLSDRSIEPARCDIDADGDQDLVIGYARPGVAEISILRMQAGSIAQTIVVDLKARDPATLGHLGGIRSIPACGDPDGDGRNEIVVAFGRGSLGVFVLIDDWTTGFEVQPPRVANGVSYLESWQFFTYRHLSGELRRAFGDVDGDGRDELVVGTLREWVVILDDAVAGFRYLGELGSPGATPTIFWASFYQLNANPPATRVALGNLDGDPADEVIVGVETATQSSLLVFDDRLAGGKSLVTVQGGPVASAPVWGAGALAHMGVAVPSAYDVDGDGVAEIVGRPALLPRAVQVLRLVGGRLEPALAAGNPNGLVDPGFPITPFPGL